MCCCCFGCCCCFAVVVILVVVVVACFVFVVATIVVFCWCFGFVVVVFLMLLCCKQARGREQNIKKGGEVEQLPVKIKGGNYVCKCEYYGVLFLFLLFVCVLLQSTITIGVSAKFWALFFGFLSAKRWINKWATIGSISGPYLGSWFLSPMWPTY